MLLTELSAAWVKEVEDYEARMYDYFTECSVKLREWYSKGGDESEAYRQEYTRLSDEYQHYIQYIQQLRDFMKRNEKPLSDVNEVPPKATEPPVTMCHQPVIGTTVSVAPAQLPAVYNAANAAACYTKYYQDMISYFDKLLTTLEATEPTETHASQSDDAPEDEDYEEDAVPDDAELDSPFENGDLCSDPRAVMEQYFERFGETGKWDWASWNNYLSWIARTNPQWYAIFLEYSQSLGIDWDQMYDRWKTSNPLANETYEDSSAGPIDVAAIRPPDLNQPVYHGLLFGVDSHQQEAEEDDGDDLFCRTCQMRFGTDRAFTLHLRGVTHIQRALEGLQRRNPEHIDRGIVQQPEENGAARHYAWFQRQYMQKTQSEFIRPGSLYCELCSVQSTSYITLQAHLNGKRHRENVALFHSNGDASQLKDKRPVPTKTTARLQTLLDVCTQPLIGLNYIVERQFGDEEECAYFCELCSERLCRQDAIKHVCDVAHRTNYMKAHYPGMCAIVASDQSTLSMRMKRIDLFARKIEDFEGRKRVKVKRLSAFDALRRIWRPLDESDHAPLQMPRWTTKAPKANVQQNAALKKPVKPASVKEQSTVSTKQPAEHRKPPSEDLEEGEITEDSSDEDETDQVNATSGEKNESSVFPTGPILNGNIHECAESADSTMEDVCPEDFLPHPVATFRADTECETFIETLRKDGFLNLGKATVESEQTDKSSNDVAVSHSSSVDDQFAREAEWVLSRVRERQKEEEENRRQVAASVSAAAKSQALMASAEERRIRVQRGLDAVEESRRALDSATISTPSRFFSNEEYEENAVPSSRSPEPQPSPTPLEEDIDERTSSSPIIDPACLGLLGPMDPSRKKLAVSSGAVEIILSALGALRDAGQLPECFAPKLNSPPSSPSPKADEPTEPTAPAVKVGLLGPASTPVSSVPKPVIVLQPSTILPVSTSRGEHPQPTKVTVPSFQVNADPRSGLLNPNPSGPLPVLNNAPLLPSLPKSNVFGAGLFAPGLLDMPDVHPRNPGVGLLGDPLPHRPSIIVPITTTTAPPKKDSSHLSPKTSSPQISAKVPRLVVDNSSDDGAGVADPPSEPKKEEEDQTPAMNVASYMKATTTTESSEAIFDAYALYSRRSQERNKVSTPSRPADDARKGDSTKQVFRRGRSRFSGPVGTQSGRKLSVIADLLGVNEPPAPHPKASPAHSSRPAPNSNDRPNPSYWQQKRESSYLVPYSSDSSPALSRISYYVPKDQTDSRSSALPPLPHRNSGFGSRSIGAVPRNYLPPQPPNMTYRIMRSQLAMTDFTRHL
ncbi:unnamed protein product [Dicrocoelium dendriticum]|nr:unnamed protein product [Dicrocoelium dendriticum]